MIGTWVNGKWIDYSIDPLYGHKSFAIVEKYFDKKCQFGFLYVDYCNFDKLDREKFTIFLVDGECDHAQQLNSIIDTMISSNWLIITQCPSFYKFCIERNVLVFIIREFETISELIPLRFHYMNHQLKLNNSKHNFFCLNRIEMYHRNVTIKKLQDFDLIKHGFVTFDESKKIITDLNVDDSIEYKNYNYKVNTGIAETNDYLVNNIWSTANTTNLIHIRENIRAPIYLCTETTVDVLYPGEKSIIGFFSHAIPILISAPGHVEMLRQHKFDMFDDIINHNYDEIESTDKRIKFAIKKNYEILKTGIDQKKYQKRLDYNFNYLIYDYLDLCVHRLVNEINNLIFTYSEKLNLSSTKKVSVNSLRKKIKFKKRKRRNNY